MKKFLPHLLACTIFLSLGVGLVHAHIVAGGTSNTGGNFLPNPFNCGSAADSTGNCTLAVFLTTILTSIVLPLGGILAVLAFIWSGFLYVTAQGNSEKVKTAHRALLYTAIGSAVLLGAVLIMQVVQNTLNQL